MTFTNLTEADALKLVEIFAGRGNQVAIARNTTTFIDGYDVMIYGPDSEAVKQEEEKENDRLRRAILRMNGEGVKHDHEN